MKLINKYYIKEENLNIKKNKLKINFFFILILIFGLFLETKAQVVGYIVGNTGAVYKTTNSGANWTYISSGLTFGSNTLNSVHFVDASTGYIVGNSGAVYKTTNSGANWTYISSGLTFGSNSLNGVHFVDASTGYIVGNSGAVYKTTNSGANWTYISSGLTFGSNSLNDIYFINTMVSLSELSEENLLLIYPNPFTNEIYFKTEGDIKNKKYFIYNTSGQVIESGILNGNKINCSDFSKGLYFIKLEGTTKTFKLVKEN